MASSTKVNFTLLASEWGSKRGGLSYFNRVLAIELAKHSKVHVSVLVPRCDQEEMNDARSKNVTLAQAKKRTGLDEKYWLCFPPDDLQIDVVIGHGAVLGSPAQTIQANRRCKWVQFVYTDPVEFGMFKVYSDRIEKGKQKHQTEVELCAMADFVVAVGTKLAEAYRQYLRSHDKDESVFDLTPGIFDEFSGVKQATQDGDKCRVLVFGRGDAEDFKLKGLDIAAKAVSQLQDAILIFVDAGNKLQDRVADHFQQCGIPPERLRVRTFLESWENLKKIFREVDVAIMPSRTNGFGLLALKALSAGLPILAGGNSGFGKALAKVRFGSGCVIQSDDPTVWAEEIKRVWAKDREIRLEESDELRKNYAEEYSWAKQCNDLVELVLTMAADEEAPSLKRKASNGSSPEPGAATLPREIQERGPEARQAFERAIRSGKVNVYRGRIMFIGQDGAGKTSLKKSLLGLPFNAKEDSTEGIELDLSKFEVDVDRVKNWQRIKKKDLDENIAMMIAAKLMDKSSFSEQTVDRGKNRQTGGSTDSGVHGNERKDEADEQENVNVQDTGSTEQDLSKELTSTTVASSTGNVEERSKLLDLDFLTSAGFSSELMEIIVPYLNELKLDEEIKAEECMIDMWDFAGQHLYYASHSVFLSSRALYILVCNLSKGLNDEAEPCYRQGMTNKKLKNQTKETNLENLLSWLVSVRRVRPKVDEDVSSSNGQLNYVRPPVIIVGTNADHPAVGDANKMLECVQRSVDEYELREHVVSEFTVDNTGKQPDDREALREKILEVLKMEPYFGQEMPIRWLHFEKIVQTLVKKKIHHVKTKDLRNVIEKVCKIYDEEEIMLMLDFYHDLGQIVKHGSTVVLQTQWLIDLFKQVITVPHREKQAPTIKKCWKELQDHGILEMDLINHVFEKYIQEGLEKSDILDLMEHYGLIAKFSPDSKTAEPRYFVPAQLTSTPVDLCDKKPSDCDPCLLYIKFTEGFVPHGLFPQLLTRCIAWCSKHGFPKEPQLHDCGARFFIGKQPFYSLVLICRKRSIKIVLTEINPASGSSRSTTKDLEPWDVRDFLDDTLTGLSQELPWLCNLEFEWCVACTGCQCAKHKSVCCLHEECLHLHKVDFSQTMITIICEKSLKDETITVSGLDKWLQASKESETEKHSTVNPLPSTGPSASKSRRLSGKSSNQTPEHTRLDVVDSEFEDVAAPSSKRKASNTSSPEPGAGPSASKSSRLSGKSNTQTPEQTRLDVVDSEGEPAIEQRSIEGGAERPEAPKTRGARAVKEGCPSKDELEKLSLSIGSSWESLARRLEFTDEDIIGFHKNNEEYQKKALKMLFGWKEKYASDATYKVLHFALCHEFVKRRDLAEKFCCS